MKVWIVFSPTGDCGGTWYPELDKVFDSKEKAEAYVRKQDELFREDYRIKMITVK